MSEFDIFMKTYKGVMVPYYIFNLLTFGNASLPDDVSEKYIKEKYGLDVEIRHSTRDSGNMGAVPMTFHIATLVGGQLTIRGEIVE